MEILLSPSLPTPSPAPLPNFAYTDLAGGGKREGGGRKEKEKIASTFKKGLTVREDHLVHRGGERKKREGKTPKEASQVGWYSFPLHVLTTTWRDIFDITVPTVVCTVVGFCQHSLSHVVWESSRWERKREREREKSCPSFRNLFFSSHRCCCCSPTRTGNGIFFIQTLGD